MSNKSKSKGIEEYMKKTVSIDTVSEYIKLAYKRHFKDLKNVEKKRYPYYFDSHEAMKVIFFSKNIKHSKGEAAGNFFKPTKWQEAMMYIIFGWRMKKNDKRRFKRVYYEVARKNGKTFLSTIWALYAWLCEGEKGSEGYCIATKQEQASIAFTDLENHVKGSEVLKDEIEIYRNKISKPGTRHFFKTLGKNSKTEDGASAHVILCDEYHAHPTNELLHVMESGSALRVAPLTIITTTAGYNFYSPCYEERDRGIKILKGEIEDESSVYFIYSMSEKDSWLDEKTWKKSNPLLDVKGAVSTDFLKRETNKAKQNPSLKNDFITKNLNRWTQSSGAAWVELKQWEALGTKKKFTTKDMIDRRVYVAFDLSTVNDITAVCYFSEETENEPAMATWRLYVPSRNIIEKSRHDRVPYDKWAEDGWVIICEEGHVSYDEVIDDFLNEAVNLHIEEVIFDPYNAQFLKSKIENECIQNPQIITMPQTYQSLSPHIARLEQKIIEKKFIHDNSPVLRWMFQNVRVKIKSGTSLRRFEKPKRSETVARIDGVAALLMACGRCYANEPEEEIENDGVILTI